MASIDLNADCGEGYGVWSLGDDAALMEVITSANIACGFHAGDPAGLRQTCAAAVAADVRIGAQVSYPDRVGFGRRFIDTSADDLTADVIYQIGALDGIARSVGGRVAYVKPHGALYNTIVTHETQARAVVDAMVSLGGTLPLLCLPGSTVWAAAESVGVRTVGEAFADRAYRADGSLAPRSARGAVLSDTHAIAARAVTMARSQRVTSIDGGDVEVGGDSVCLHGDTPGAVKHARAVATALREAGIVIAPFA